MARLVVFIDPDGTAGDWTYVVVAHPTGVAYAQQYGGTACRQGELEGYLVPVDGSTALINLRDVFERELGGTGVWSRGFQWPDELLDRVAGAVEGIRYWPTDDGLPDHLRLDRSRLSDLDEAWVPVLTPDGPAVLLWANSD